MFGQTTQVVSDDSMIVSSIMEQIDLMRSDIFKALDDKKSIQARLQVLKLKESLNKEAYRSILLSTLDSLYFLEDIQSLPVEKRMKEYLRLRIFASLGFTLSLSDYEKYKVSEIPERYAQLNNTNTFNSNLPALLNKKSTLQSIFFDENLPTFLEVMFYNNHKNNFVRAYRPTNTYQQITCGWAKDHTYLGGLRTKLDNLHNELNHYTFENALSTLKEIAQFMTYEKSDVVPCYNYIDTNNFPFMNFRVSSGFRIGEIEPFKSYLESATSNQQDPNYLQLRKDIYLQYQPLIKEVFNEMFDKIIPLMLKWEYSKFDLKFIDSDIANQDKVINQIKTRITGTLNSLREVYPEHDFPTLEDILLDYENRNKVTTKEEVETEDKQVLSEETKELANEKKSNLGLALGVGAVIAAITLLG